MYTKSTKNDYITVLLMYIILQLVTFCSLFVHACLYFFTCSLQEAVGDTLQELWISYNNIEKLKGITVLAKLKV